MKRYVLYGLSVVVALSAAADVISPARALERVRDMAAVPSRVASLRGGSAVEPMLTVDAADGSGQAAVYVFSSRDKAGDIWCCRPMMTRGHCSDMPTPDRVMRTICPPI